MEGRRRWKFVRENVRIIWGNCSVRGLLAHAGWGYGNLVFAYSTVYGASGGGLERILRPVNIADVMLPPSRTSVTTTAMMWRMMTAANA